MPTPAEVVEQGFARGEEARLQKQAQRETFDLAQKQWQRDQAMSAANRIAVPDAATDPEGNAKALKQRQALIDMAQNVFTPEDHGNFFHRLIFGPQAQQTTPVSSQAPQTPGTYTPPSTGPIPNQPLQTMPLSSHPFVNNPQHNKLLQDLDALNNRLKFAIHPPKQASPSLSSLIAGIPGETPLNDLVAKYQKFEELSKGKTPEEQERLAELFGIKHGSVAVKNVVSPDGKKTQAVDVNSPAAEELFAQGWKLAPTGAGGYIRQGSHVVNPGDAIKLMDSAGQKYPKQDGTDWTPEELAKFPKGTILSAFIKGDQTFYAPFDQRTKTATWDNQVHQINEAGNITPENATVEGVARVPTEHVSTQTAPGGVQVVTGTSRVTPVTPGTTASSSPAQRAPSTRTAVPSRSAAQGPVSSRAPRFGGESILPNIQKMTPRNAAMAQKAQPAVSALLGLYGDPSRPEVRSMADFAPLAADPHAQKVLGEAFKLLDQSMGEVSDPGIIQTLGTAAGWANFRAQAEAGAQQSAGTKMTDEEKEYFDTAIASMADIIGARSATGQSPARFSVKSIQNELPLIGTSSVTDPKQYLTKMLTISRQIQVGLNAMPDNARALKWLLKRENDLIKQSNDLSPTLNKKKPVSSQAPRVSSGTIVQKSPSTGKYRYSTDGGESWQPGQPPSK